MPKKRPYDQFCPIATALDQVGDRWILLIVRELFVGPMRYRELLRALDPIATDVLAGRLRDLQALDLVARDGSTYQLTPHGRSLGPVLAALGRWGTSLLEPQPEPERLLASRAVQLLAIAGAAARPEAERGVVELWADGEVWSVSTGPGGTVVERGEAVTPDGVVTTDGPTLWALRLGRISWSDAIDANAIRAEGDRDLARQILDPS